MISEFQERSKITPITDNLSVDTLVNDREINANLFSRSYKLELDGTNYVIQMKIFEIDDSEYTCQTVNIMMYLYYKNNVRKKIYSYHQNMYDENNDYENNYYEMKINSELLDVITEFLYVVYNKYCEYNEDESDDALVFYGNLTSSLWKTEFEHKEKFGLNDLVLYEEDKDEIYAIANVSDKGEYTLVSLIDIIEGEINREIYRKVNPKQLKYLGIGRDYFKLDLLGEKFYGEEDKENEFQE
jgi:hypothetical protein